MANALYDTGRNAFLLADVDWLVDTITAVLVDTGAYTVNLTTHQFLSDIAGGARIATQNMAGMSASAGVADANDTVFTAVSGTTVEAVVIYKNTGTAGTSQLIAYIDTATGLPVTPNGGDITVQWDNGANKIFKL
jgi:hypothetical protein